VSIVVEGALALLLLGAALIVVALAIKLLRGGGGGGQGEEESRIIRDTYLGLSRLEERIEALETILHDLKDGESGK
jgi:hypothetical protein